MKWFQMAIVAFVLVVGANHTMAGGGHYHGPVSQQRVGDISQNLVNNMARKGDLASSWTTASRTSLDRTTIDGNLVWKAVFANEQESDPSRRNLHVFLTLTGGFIKAKYAAK
ncbi:MAG: hypothetical protein HQL53_09995 [Magnetococcales bacterium]|nr:hypothetical protein [Magnetococcales bacterium]